MTRSDRTKELLKRLPIIYPEAHCELDYSNPLELLVATILSVGTIVHARDERDATAD